MHMTGLLVAHMYSISDLFINVYLADIFDIALITVFLYSALLLFKQTRSFLILGGIGIIMVIYTFAQVFHLYLTSLALQSFFSVFLIVLVIIFQEELRRFLEFIAAVSTRQISARPISADSEPVSALLQAVAYLAHNKIGALMVIRGRENIDRLLDGGSRLDGLISEELVLSIFDPTSPGHDGAIVIYKDRIAVLGAHLPLSNNFQEIGKHGTRHSAALGIVEKSDAFAIVVSEEQGTISVAEGGKLEHMRDIESLRNRLKTFLKEKSPEQTYSVWENIIQRNSLEKIVALCIASILWFFVAFRAETLQQKFTLSVSYSSVPDGFLIENTKPNTLDITLSGRGKSSFDQLDEKNLGVVIDASKVKGGLNTMTVDESMVTHPVNFSVVNIEPQKIELVVKKFQSIDIPITAELSGRPDSGFVIDAININPNRVTLLVPEGITAPDHIFTESIAVQGVKETTTFPGKLVIPKNLRLKTPSDENIFVTITVRRK